jgi:hypothetical protein
MSLLNKLLLLTAYNKYWEQSTSLAASTEIQMVVGSATYQQSHKMVSNESILMCGDASVTNAPLCIHQSTQIINQLDGSILKKVSTYY